MLSFQNSIKEQEVLKEEEKDFNLFIKFSWILDLEGMGFKPWDYFPQEVHSKITFQELQIRTRVFTLKNKFSS